MEFCDRWSLLISRCHYVDTSNNTLPFLKIQEAWFVDQQPCLWENHGFWWFCPSLKLLQAPKFFTVQLWWWQGATDHYPAHQAHPEPQAKNSEIWRKIRTRKEIPGKGPMVWNKSGLCQKRVGFSVLPFWSLLCARGQLFPFANPGPIINWVSFLDLSYSHRL